MSLLGMMMIRWNIADDKIGYEYSFHDYVVKGYISQDHVHVGAIIQLASRIINDNGLEIQNIIIQSDNASGFSSINLIPFIYNMNSYNKKKKLLVISRWIFAEAQTSKRKLDAHFSFLNIKLKSFVEDDNYIIVEDNIVQGISSLDGVKGTTVYLVDVSTIGVQTLINQNFIDTRIKIRWAHDIIWDDDKVTVTEKSGITDGIIIGKDKLDRYGNYDLKIVVTMQSTSKKEQCGIKLKKMKKLKQHQQLILVTICYHQKQLFFQKNYKILVSYQKKIRYQTKKVTTSTNIL